MERTLTKSTLLREIVVHVGQSKTGTTRIQNALAANAEKLLSQGVFYPRPRPDITAHHALVRQICEKSDRRLEKAIFGNLGDDELILSALGSNNSCHTAVLSSEMLLIHFEANSEHVQAFDNRLSSLAQSVRYVAYVRDPVERFPSVCSQTLMRSAMLPRVQWAFRVSEMVKLRELVGPRFEIRVYDRDAFKNRDVFEDFVTGVLGAGVSDLDLTTANDKSNVSLSAEGMYLVQAVALARQIADPAGFPSHDPAMQQMAQFVRRIDASQGDYSAANLKPEMPALIAAHAEDELSLLREKLDIELSAKVKVATPKDGRHQMYLQLVGNVFVVDPQRTASLARILCEHPRCPEELMVLLNRIQMPATEVPLDVLNLC